ncbi:hypothetical protein C0989_011292 [Termitomyces sp. Mn162]|nr:hypothetical protein C0989_011292 [Termitomyces sp. Mn162]
MSSQSRVDYSSDAVAGASLAGISAIATQMHPLDAPSSLSSDFDVAACTSRGDSTPLLTARKTVKQHFSAKEKGKDKAKEPELSTAMDEQLAHLLQWLHKARVLEDVSAEILNNPVVQLALSQVLNELDVVQNQRDEACMDLFH